MRYHVWKLFQMTAKCLLRSKAFLFFVFVLPLLASLLLNIKLNDDVITKDGTITELSNPDDRVAYLNNYSMYPVKIYVQNQSKVTDAVLNEVLQTGMFQIYRVDAAGLSNEAITQSIEKTANNDKIGAVVVFGKTFDQDLIDGNIENITAYQIGDDERYSMLSASLKTTLQKYMLLGKKAGSVEKLGQTAETKKESAVTLQPVKKESKNTVLGMDVNYQKTCMLGSALAILSISFCISGVLILNTLIKERENLVFTRVLLSKANSLSYLLSKFAIVFFTSLIQSVVATTSYWLLVRSDIGITVFEFAYIVFLLGLLFNFLSICIGVFAGSTITALYLTFIVWMITALLGGMYFDISTASGVYQKIAMLMPQRWGLKAASMFMSGNLSAYPLLLVVTSAFIIVIMIASIMGLKMNRKE